MKNPFMNFVRKIGMLNDMTISIERKFWQYFQIKNFILFTDPSSISACNKEWIRWSAKYATKCTTCTSEMKIPIKIALVIEENYKIIFSTE